MINNLTINQAAEFLHVTSRTISSWESGDTRIPYPAFKLLRLLVNGELLSDAWKGWRVRGDTLYTPTGRAFKQHELNYLSHYITMARYWLQERKRKVEHTQEAEVSRPRLRLVNLRNSLIDLADLKDAK